MNTRHLYCVASLALLVAAQPVAAGNSAGAAPVRVGPPSTTRLPVADEYHGAKVVDDYRWLEDWNDARVKEWSEAQNQYTRSVLDALASVEPIRQRITQLENAAGVEYSGLEHRPTGLFALKHQPIKQQPMLVKLVSADDLRGERIVFDPNAADDSGLTAIDWFVPSPDGKLVAISISKAGSEAGDVHVFDAATGKEFDTDLIPRVNGGTAGGSLAWAPDSKSFYYTRYPRVGERPADDLDFYVQVYSHTLGENISRDRYELGKDFPKIAEIVLQAGKTGHVMASVQKGDGGEFMFFLRAPGQGAEWRQLARYEDKVIQAVVADDGAVFMVSRQGAPRGKVLRLAAGAGHATPSVADAQVIIPESSYSIESDFFSRTGITLSESRLFVQYQAGGPSEVGVFDLTGKSLGNVKLPPIAAVHGVVPLPEGDALIGFETYLTPPEWLRYDASDAASRQTALVMTSDVDYSEYEVVREFATSKDGTKVPVNIIRSKRLGEIVDLRRKTNEKLQAAAEKAKKEGVDIAVEGDTLVMDAVSNGTQVIYPAPTILWGYGGYGVSESPAYSARRKLWLEQGGVFAIANIRGGGEFGEEWHRQGNLTNKQNVFDDFFAAAKLLLDGYTTRERFAIMGGSNGGLLMGATLTQHPDLCKAVVSSVGIYDMLRVELSANGAFNVTEFGTVKDPAQFKALRAYSPYHNVVDGTQYPDVLFITGANDPRVDPMQSRKMTARLQAASPGSKTLLRTSANAGHGIGSSLAQRIEQNVDVYSFLFSELGVAYKPATDKHEVDPTK